MARTQKPTAAELMAQKAADAQAAPILDYITTTTLEPTEQKIEQDTNIPNNVDNEQDDKENTDEKEQEGKKKKKPTKNGMALKSFYCNESVFNQLAELAGYRSIIKGEKNNKGQNLGAGTLINEAATEYLERHMDELNQCRQLMQPVKNGISWTRTEKDK